MNNIAKLQEQLARKTQECESLKEEIEVLKDNFDTATRDCNELIEELKQECEELENKIKKLRKNLALEIEINDRYRETLEEIKKVCIEDTREFADGTTVRYDSLDEILDIINKAKEKICYWDKSIDMSKATLQVDGEIICKFDNDNQTVILVNDNYLTKAKDGKNE